MNIPHTFSYGHRELKNSLATVLTAITILLNYVDACNIIKVLHGPSNGYLENDTGTFARAATTLGYRLGQKSNVSANNIS